MAEKYVDSAAAGAGTGADWANAYTTIAAAAAGVAAGDTIWISATSHAEITAGAVSPAFPGTLAAPNHIYSVNKAGSVPPVAADLLAGASIATTGANAITISGSFYMWGVTLTSGSGASIANIMIGGAANRIQMEECQLVLGNTSASSRISLANSTGANSSFKNCKVKFGATTQSVTANGAVSWQNDESHPAIDGTGSTPATFIASGSALSPLEFRGLDLSAISGTLNVAATLGLTRLIGCKLHASTTIAQTPSSVHALGTELIGCSSTTAPYRNEKYNQRGTLTTETTIVRTGGALGPDSTPVSWKIVTTADAKRAWPFRSFEIDVPNTATGSAKTITFHTVTDGVTLTDAEAWVEVDYLGVSTSPLLYSLSDAGATPLTTGANQTTSTATWTTTGLASPVKQQLSVTITPQMAGLIRCRLVIAKASTTVYVCPLPVVS